MDTSRSSTGFFKILTLIFAENWFLDLRCASKFTLLIKPLVHSFELKMSLPINLSCSFSYYFLFSIFCANYWQTNSKVVISIMCTPVQMAARLFKTTTKKTFYLFLTSLMRLWAHIYQISYFSHNSCLSNGLWPPPPRPFFRKNVAIFFYEIF